MTSNVTRRNALQSMATLLGGSLAYQGLPRQAYAGKKVREWEQSIKKGLNWIQKTQSSLGHWTAGNYPTAMTALGGTALICSGSTTTQGPYAKAIRQAVNYLTSNSRANG